MSAALPRATDDQAARAIAHVSCVLLAAKNGNQHNENMIVLMDQATAMFQALAEIDGEAPAHEPAADAPNVGAPRNWSPDLAEYVQDIVQQAFEEGKARGRWEAAAHARTALARTAPVPAA